MIYTKADNKVGAVFWLETGPSFVTIAISANYNAAEDNGVEEVIYHFVESWR